MTIILQCIFKKPGRETLVDKLIVVFTIEPHHHEKRKYAQGIPEIFHILLIRDFLSGFDQKSIVVLLHYRHYTRFEVHTLYQEKNDVRYSFVYMYVLPIQEIRLRIFPIVDIGALEVPMTEAQRKLRVCK